MITYPVVKVIIQPEKMVFVSRIMLVDILQKFYLVKTLVKEVFVILYDFYTDVHSCLQVMRLYGFTESC